LLLHILPLILTSDKDGILPIRMRFMQCVECIASNITGGASTKRGVSVSLR
jgi:hypothetical protein